MKYLKECLNEIVDKITLKIFYYDNLIWFFESELNIPNKVIENFERNPQTDDYLYENLFVHDKNKLQDKLSKLYDISFEDYEDGSFYMIYGLINDII